jgi:hypothetical protein
MRGKGKKREVKKVNMVDVLTSYTRINTEF